MGYSQHCFFKRVVLDLGIFHFQKRLGHYSLIKLLILGFYFSNYIIYLFTKKRIGICHVLQQGKKLIILFCQRNIFFLFIFVEMYYLMVKGKEMKSYCNLRLGNLLSPIKGPCHYLYVSIGFYLYRTRIGLRSHLSFRALPSGMLNVLNAIIFDI